MIVPVLVVKSMVLQFFFCKKHLDEFDQILFNNLGQRSYDCCFEELQKDIPCPKCII